MATIIGTNKKLCVDSNSHLLQIRFAAADAKTSLQRYIKQNPLMVKTPLSKSQVKDIFYRNTFDFLPRKNIETLCEFLFRQAEKKNYIVKVPKIWTTDPDEFIVNPDILNMKPGPRKNEQQ